MFPIALNTFREIIRNRFFLLLIFFGVVFIGFSTLLDTLSLGETRRIIFDFGLSFIELSGFAVILFLAGGMIAREIDGRTIYLMLSKPISRGMILFGKFFGFSWVICLTMMIETLLLIAMLSFHGYSLDLLFFLAVIGIWIKLEILLALILFFSTFTSAVLSVFLTLASYMIGHSGYGILDYAIRNDHPVFLTLARGVLAIFPNLESLNWKNYVATNAVIDPVSVVIAIALALVYLGIILIFSMRLFSQKSFDAA